jgi:DNA-binding MarR family transcriptional regulator
VVGTDLTSGLHQAVEAISAQLRLRFAASSSEGIGFVALATLRHLTRHGSRTVSQLAEADRVTTQAISLRVRPLVEAGLVTRGIDPRDGRRTVVEATALGRSAVAQTQSSIRRSLEDAIRRLPPADRAALSAAVDPLLQIAKNLEDEL